MQLPILLVLLLIALTLVSAQANSQSFCQELADNNAQSDPTTELFQEDINKPEFLLCIETYDWFMDYFHAMQVMYGNREPTV